MRLFILLSAFVYSSVFAQDWRTPESHNLVYLQLEKGTVVIELAPFIAPNHVRQFKKLVNEGYYDGLDFYRVIDGFVAQAGDLEESKPSEFNQPLALEATRASVNDDFILIQEGGHFAAQTGYLFGFPAGKDTEQNREWLLHCPSTVAMARSTEANSGSSHFYVAIGQAPRHLDRNMSVFGRVIWGMQWIQRVPRGNVQNGGVIEQPEERAKIISAKLARGLPLSEQLPIQVQQVNGKAFLDKLQSARSLSNDFYVYKGTGYIDVCYHQPRSRLKPE